MALSITAESTRLPYPSLMLLDNANAATDASRQVAQMSSLGYMSQGPHGTYQVLPVWGSRFLKTSKVPKRRKVGAMRMTTEQRSCSVHWSL